MRKLAIVLIIIVALVPLIIAPFTFRDQVQGFLSWLFNSPRDQNNQDSNSDFDLVDTDVSRVFNETSCISFITPNDPSVVNLRNEILQDPIAALTPDWMKFRDWVGNEIEYSG